MRSTNKLSEAIDRALNARLKQFTSSTATRATCLQIYNEIFQCLVEVFEMFSDRSSVELTNEALNFLAQMYYDSIVINQNQELDPNIFTQRASVKNLETKELALLGLMFSGTELAIPFVQEVRHRS